LRAKKRIHQAKQLLKELGIEPERVEMFNVGASDAGLFARACDEMAGRVLKLGPSPLNKKNTDSELKTPDSGLQTVNRGDAK
jgi:F420-non-reducing hydrogenase iron-sulfur subunit